MDDSAGRQPVELGEVMRLRGLSVPFALLILAQSSLSPLSGSAVRLTATALIMGGTGQSLAIPPDTPEFVGRFVNQVYDQLVGPSRLCDGGEIGCTRVAVFTPEELAPLIGHLPFGQSVAMGKELLDNCLRGAQCTATAKPFTATKQVTLTDTYFVVVGGSQSAIISSEEKSDLITRPAHGKTISFILTSNQKRPNGGVLQRFVGFYLPILDIAFNGSTPTNSSRAEPLTTVDITVQYDGWADFPNNPLNLLANINALLGMAFLHSDLLDIEEDPELQGQYQDTTYYLYPSALLPLLEPVAVIPVVGPIVAAALYAPLRVLVEAGYGRTINPGEPTPANFLYFPNPLKLLGDFLVAIPTGWDDAISYFTADPDYRPFGTASQPVYGVGGPPVYSGAVDPYGPPTPISKSTWAGAAATQSVMRANRNSPEGHGERSVDANPKSQAADTHSLFSRNAKSRGEDTSARPSKGLARVRPQPDRKFG